jgi:ribosome-binding protein aMBF1 (putative translation factor)
MDKCARCQRSEEEVRLFDGLYINEAVRMCERCAILSNIPIIKRPSTDQLKSSEQPYSVRERLMHMNRLDVSSKQEKTIPKSLKELENRPELEKPEDLVFKLVDNFHWVIQTERRRKGLTTKQLADLLGESESALKLLEKGIVPSKSMNLITAIEQFLKVKIIKRDLLISSQMTENSKYNSNKPEKKEELFIKKMQESEANDMVKSAILNEKNTELGKIERAGKYPLDASLFKERDKSNSVIELKKRSEIIEQDFTKKTGQEIGKEQTANFGKEEVFKRTLYRERPKNVVPTIYELMKKKQEKEKTSVTGKDIALLD